MPWWLQHLIFIGINRVIYTGGLISQWEKRRGGVPANPGLVLLAVAGSELLANPPVTSMSVVTWEKRRGGVPANQGLVLLAVAG